MAEAPSVRTPMEIGFSQASGARAASNGERGKTDERSTAKVVRVIARSWRRDQQRITIANDELTSPHKN